MRCPLIVTLVGMSFFPSDGSMVKRISSLAEGKEMVFSKNRGKIILVDYWAKWCGPCLAFSPVFESIAADFALKSDKILFFKVEVSDDVPEAVEEARIEMLPTIKIYYNGNEASSLSQEGLSESNLRDSIGKMLKEIVDNDSKKKRRRRRKGGRDMKKF